MQTTLNFPDPTTARQALFLSTDDQPFTTSRSVAEKFGKRHAEVTRMIKLLINNMGDSDFSQRNFASAEYLDEQKKPRLEYRLTHDGFAFVAMRFTGKEAMQWQIAFIEAFNQMETELNARTQRYASALDIIRPALRPVTEGTEHGLDRSTIGEQLGKSVGSVSYHRRKARELGLLH
jgi:Rha family phage regulatory protein